MPETVSGGRVLWCALHLPALRTDGCPASTSATLESIATLCQQVSAHISLLPPDTVVFECGSTLRHFTGIHSLRRHLADCLEPLGQPWVLAATPTIAASALLARSGHDTLVADRSGLRAALGRLPLALLPASPRTLKRLHHSGLERLRDLWRLPSDALRKRAGARLSHHLACCLGQQDWPLPRWQPPLCFHRNREFDWPLTDTRSLLIESEELSLLLEQFLQRHGVALEQMEWQLHEDSTAIQSLILTFRQPLRHRDEWQPLLTLRLEQSPPGAPVHGMTLKAKHFVPFTPAAGGFTAFHEAGQQQSADSAWQHTLDLLEARLGPEALSRLSAQADWSPETAGGETTDRSISPPTAGTFESLPSRPVWLITPPRRLQTRNGKPRLHGALTVLSGPERIETRWWESQAIRRDYYMVETMRGQRLWIFRALQETGHWYLHGLFG